MTQPTHLELPPEFILAAFLPLRLRETSEREFLERMLVSPLRTLHAQHTTWTTSVTRRVYDSVNYIAFTA